MLSYVLNQYRQAYSGLPAAVWLLSLVTLANRVGTMVMPFMALYLTKERALSVAQSGQLLSLFGLGAILGGYYGGWLATKYRPTWVQAVMLSLMATTLFFFAYFETLVEFGAGLFLVGLFSEGFRPANATAMTNACPAQFRARAFALNRLAINVGMALGPAMGGFLAVRDYRLLFLVDGATCLLAAFLVVILFYQKEPEIVETSTQEESSGSLFSCFKDGLFLCVLFSFLICLIVFMQFESTFLVYLKDYYSFVESQMGILYGLNTGLIIAFEMVLTHRLERYNHLIVTGIGSLLICLGFGMLPFGNTIGFAALVIVIATFGEMIALPMAGAWVANRSTKQNRGMYMGLFSASFGIAVMSAPLIGMGVYASSPHAMWYVAIGLGVLLFFFFYLMSRQEKQSIDSGSVQKPDPQ